MDLFCDSEYLKKTQYKNADNLNTRINLHQRFSTNPQDWQEWVFDKADIQDGQTILEIGSGPGTFWTPNINRLPQAIIPVLTDLSFGMSNDAKKLNEPKFVFHAANVDSMRLPFKNESFDKVIANHMLYHVPDIATVLRESSRVLRPGGVMVAATNGENHMHEIYILLAHLLPEFFTRPRVVRRFNLENGVDLLRKKFCTVKNITYDDSLKVTEVQPLIAYMQSLWGAYLEQTALTSLSNLIQHEIDDQGYFYIQKSTGVFIASDPK